MKKLAVGLAALLIIGAPAYWWLLVESAQPSGTFALDLAELRTLADALPGEKPKAIRVEHVAGFEFPGIAVFAGDSWATTKMPVFSYQLVFDDRTALIDTAMDGATAKGESAPYFDDAAFTRLTAAMERADFIVVTHEHFDHLGGASTFAKVSELKLKLTRAQLSDPTKQKPLRLPEQISASLDYERAVALAPGVVAWKAPGHTPGSQLVFVKRADGEEFLFLGDVAWHQQNWQQVHERARLVTQFFLGEDRDAVLRQLAAIKALATAEPKLHVVPGHDGPAVDALISAGLLVPKFE